MTITLVLEIIFLLFCFAIDSFPKWYNFFPIVSFLSEAFRGDQISPSNFVYA